MRPLPVFARAVSRPLCALILCVAASAASAQPAVPRDTYTNAIAGFSIDIPEDWEMCTGDLGNTMIALDADAGIPTGAVFPVLWFFRASEPPREMANSIAAGLDAMDHSSPGVREGADGEWIVSAASNGPRGALVEEWHCRQEGNDAYVLATMVRPEQEPNFREDLAAAVASCRLAPTPRLKLYTEPGERAFCMVVPEDWTCRGHVFRTPLVPGYFQWEASSPDGLAGAFSGPPAVLNITVPYVPADRAAEEIVLPALRQQIPDARLVAVHELPRPGRYYEEAIRRLGIGDKPRMDKVRADYLAVRNGVEVRARVTIGTVMLGASDLLGGRGDWWLLTNGYWAPDDRFDELAPVGRGVVASVMADPEFRRSQFEAGNEAATWGAWNRELSFWRFMVRLWST